MNDRWFLAHQKIPAVPGILLKSMNNSAEGLWHLDSTAGTYTYGRYSANLLDRTSVFLPLSYPRVTQRDTNTPHPPPRLDSTFSKDVSKHLCSLAGLCLFHFCPSLDDAKSSADAWHVLWNAEIQEGSFPPPSLLTASLPWLSSGVEGHW